MFFSRDHRFYLMDVVLFKKKYPIIEVISSVKLSKKPILKLIALMTCQDEMTGVLHLHQNPNWCLFTRKFPKKSVKWESGNAAATWNIRMGHYISRIVWNLFRKFMQYFWAANIFSSKKKTNILLDSTGIWPTRYKAAEMPIEKLHSSVRVWRKFN